MQGSNGMNGPADDSLFFLDDDLLFDGQSSEEILFGLGSVELPGHSGTQGLETFDVSAGGPSQPLLEWPGDFHDLSNHEAQPQSRASHVVDQAQQAYVDPRILHEYNPESALSGATLAPNRAPTIEDFFIQRGARRSPVPCSLCKRKRLQCIILQTGEANPNPTHSCSSCVALFRECSLSSGKRNPSSFETMLPVIGQLHGVPEDVAAPTGDGETFHQSRSARKSGQTRSIRKTRALKNWFVGHLDHPYPTTDEKQTLAEESGLSLKQVENWFANNRRRHRSSAQVKHSRRVFKSGSPMPQHLGSDMTPMERWRSSPPEQEPASVAAIEKAMHTQLPSSSEVSDGFNSSHSDGLSSTSGGFYAASMFKDPSSQSESSHCSSHSTDYAGMFSPTLKSPDRVGTSASWLQSAEASPGTAPAFQCTFCHQTFKKKYDWSRHERTIHFPGLDSWVCGIPAPPGKPQTVWQVGMDEPQCLFCGHVSPTEKHFEFHEFDTCAEKQASERTFSRKDHLWQHLVKFHGCKKWEGWKPDLAILRESQELSIETRCKFCQRTLRGWSERIDHLAAHFREESRIHAPDASVHS
ncbi:Homeobox protein homothorax [Paramyrothecium foliicola]|nr:Homeobox protein homothorax [Paramyrothecium foliicola]